GRNAPRRAKGLPGGTRAPFGTVHPGGTAGGRGARRCRAAGRDQRHADLTPLARAANFRVTLHKSEEPTPACRHAAGFIGNGVGDATVPITRTSSSRSVTAVVSLVLHLLLAAVVPSLDGTVEAAVHDRQV